MSHTFQEEDTDSFAAESSDSELSAFIETTEKHMHSQNGDTKEEEPPLESKQSDDTILSSSEASEESQVYELVDENSKNAFIKLIEGRSEGSRDSHTEDFPENYSIDSVQNMVNEFLSSEHGDKRSSDRGQSFASPSRELLDSQEKRITPNNKVSMWLGHKENSSSEYESDFEVTDSEINRFALNEEFDQLSGTSATEDTEEKFSARLIQSHYRGHRTRLNVSPKLTNRRSAAIKMQSSFRRYHAQLQYKAHIEARAMSQERERRAAELHEIQQEQSAASIKIQKIYRGHVGKQISKKHRRAMKQEHNAAACVQKRYREYSRKKEIENVQKIRDDQANAATTLQKSYRGYAHRKNTQLQRRQEISAANLIQKFCINSLTRRRHKMQGDIEHRDDSQEAHSADSLYDTHVDALNNWEDQTGQANFNDQGKYEDYAGGDNLYPGEVHEDENIGYPSYNTLEEKSKDDFNTLGNIDNFLSDLSKSLEKLDDFDDKSGGKRNDEEFIQTFHSSTEKPSITPIQDRSTIDRDVHFQRQLKINHQKNRKIMLHKKVIVIQKYVRRYIVISGSILRKKRTERRQKKLEQLQKKKSVASIRIQSIIRGCLVRKRGELRNRRAIWEKRLLQVEFDRKRNASILLQAQYRMYKAKREYASMKRQLQALASIRIQAYARGYRVRRKDILGLKKSQRDSATTIQKLYRGQFVRNSADLRLRKKRRKNHRQRLAATKIQSAFRVHHAKLIIIKRASYIALAQSFVRSFIFRRRFLIRKRKIILAQSIIRAYFGKKEGRKRRQIRNFERAKRARRIEIMRQQIFIKKVMLEKKRQAQLRQKLDQKKPNLGNDIQQPANGHKNPNAKRNIVAHVAKHANFDTRPIRQGSIFKLGMKAEKSSSQSLAGHAMPFSPRTPSSAGINMWRLKKGSCQNHTLSPPSKRREKQKFSPRTIKLYRLYSHDYDIR